MLLYKIKKLILIGLCMVLLILSSCQHRERKTIDKEASSQKSGEKELVDEGEKVLVWKILTSEFMAEDAKDLRESWEIQLNELLNKRKCEYKVKIEGTTFEELKEDKNNLEKIDLITLGFIEDTYKNTYKYFSEEGYLLPLTDILKTQAKKIADSINASDFDLAKVEKEIYGLSVHLPAMNSFCYERKSLRELGISDNDIKSDFFENKTIFEKIRNKYGDYPIVYNSVGNIHGLGRYVLDNTETIIYGEDGKFENAYASSLFKNRINKIKELYDKKLLRTGNLDDKTKIFMNYDAVFTREKFKDKYEYVGKDEKKTSKDVIVVPDEAMPIMQLYWGDYKTCISSKAKKRNECIDFLTRLFTDPEIANLIQYGKKGSDYTMDKESFVVEKGKLTTAKSIGYQFTNQLITNSTRTMARDKKSYQEWFYKTYAKDFPFGFRFDGSSVQEEIEACKRVIQEKENFEDKPTTTYQKLVALEYSNIEEGLEKLNEELKEAGIAKVIEEANRQLEEWRKGR